MSGFVISINLFGEYDKFDKWDGCSWRKRNWINGIVHWEILKTNFLKVWNYATNALNAPRRGLKLLFNPPKQQDYKQRKLKQSGGHC